MGRVVGAELVDVAVVDEPFEHVGVLEVLGVAQLVVDGQGPALPHQSLVVPDFFLAKRRGQRPQQKEGVGGRERTRSVCVALLPTSNIIAAQPATTQAQFLELTSLENERQEDKNHRHNMEVDCRSRIGGGGGRGWDNLQ